MPRKKDKGDIEIPKDWEDSEEHPVVEKKSRWRFNKPTKKIRIPGLRMFNRLLAAFLMIIFFFLSQITLAFSPVDAKFMGLLFLAVAYVSAQYLWKTRRITA